MHELRGGREGPIMGRRLTNTVEYFPHTAEQGKTLFILKGRWGNNGYAFWFQLLELLCTTENHYYDCRSEDDWQYLVSRMALEEDTCTEILDLLAKLNKIDKELWATKVVWCENLVSNLEDVYRRRGRPRPNRPTILADGGISGEEIPISAPEIPQSKVKESRVEESKEKMQPPLDAEATGKLSPYLKELDRLTGWAGNAEDTVWLTEFMGEFSGFTVSHIRACRDFHSNKTKHTKALWKTRLRNWLAHERPNGGTDGRRTPTTTATNKRQSDAFADIET
ncbi:MAG: DUF4373 domain-containing protein [Gammaproteobacteria bacterium]|nr:DUF4373 domain-containing protein [Gammaproteobacteria bacterium]